MVKQASVRICVIAPVYMCYCMYYTVGSSAAGYCGGEGGCEWGHETHGHVQTVPLRRGRSVRKVCAPPSITYLDICMSNVHVHVYNRMVCIVVHHQTEHILTVVHCEMNCEQTWEKRPFALEYFLCIALKTKYANILKYLSAVTNEASNTCLLTKHEPCIWVVHLQQPVVNV